MKGKKTSAAKEAAQDMADEIIKEGNFKVRDMAVTIGKNAAKRVAQKTGKKKTPQIELYTARLIHRCEQADPYDKILTECLRLIPFVDDLTPDLARKLAQALEDMLQRSGVRVQQVVRALRSGNRPKFIALLKEKSA